MVLEKRILIIRHACDFARKISHNPVSTDDQLSRDRDWMGQDKALSMSWTAGIAFRIEGILNMEGKVLGVGGKLQQELPVSY